MKDKTNTDLYFWLGAEADLVSVTPDEFSTKIEEHRKAYQEWLNAGVEQEPGA